MQGGAARWVLTAFGTTHWLLVRLLLGLKGGFAVYLQGLSLNTEALPVTHPQLCISSIFCQNPFSVLPAPHSNGRSILPPLACPSGPHPGHHATGLLLEMWTLGNAGINSGSQIVCPVNHSRQNVFNGVKSVFFYLFPAFLKKKTGFVFMISWRWLAELSMCRLICCNMITTSEGVLFLYLS